jgi:hypothetical protein
MCGLHDHSHTGRSDGLPHGLRNLSGQPLLDLEVNDLMTFAKILLGTVGSLSGIFSPNRDDF